MSDLGDFENDLVEQALEDWRASCVICRGVGLVDGRKCVCRPDISGRVNRACAEIGREVGYRRSCYPKWVKAGRMTQEASDSQIEALEDAATLLRELSGVPR